MSQGGSGSADVELNTPNTSVNELPRSVSDVSSVPSYGESHGETGRHAVSCCLFLGSAFADRIPRLSVPQVAAAQGRHVPAVPQLLNIRPDVAEEAEPRARQAGGTPAVCAPACPGPRGTPHSAPPGTRGHCTAGRRASGCVRFCVDSSISGPQFPVRSWRTLTASSRASVRTGFGIRSPMIRLKKLSGQLWR